MYLVTYTDIVRLCIRDLLVMTSINNGGTFILMERNSLMCLEIGGMVKVGSISPCYLNLLIFFCCF